MKVAQGFPINHPSMNVRPDCASRISLLLFMSVCWLVSSCDSNRPEPRRLHLLETIDLPINEPSGLSLSEQPNQLMVVSDEDKRMYRIDLNGTIREEWDFRGNDLEGITQNLEDGSFWVVEEEASRLQHLDTDGTPIDTFALEFEQETINHGLEGVTLDPQGQRIYLVTEKDPALLIILSIRGQILDERRLKLAEDNSGIAFAPEEDLLYILSDESAEIHQTSLKGKSMESYPLNVGKAEGLAVDITNNRFYVVSDEAAQLYIFERK